ncbi:MAG: ParB-like nuclease domain-containing protein [Phycisphaerales bacterium]|nr:ParB-like nuclease domain-containing protein [Phycisphaerales bacterium]
MVARHERIINVEISKLIIDPALQFRAGVDAGVVADYAARLQDGQDPPPVLVVDVGGELLLAGGWHRLAAARLAERKTIMASVRNGTRSDALRLAIEDNAGHGLQLSRADRAPGARACPGGPRTRPDRAHRPRKARGADPPEREPHQAGTGTKFHSRARVRRPVRRARS